MIHTGKKLAAALLDLIYPRVCPVCRDVVTPKGRLICPGCREKLSYVTEPTCMRCGKPLLSEQNEYCTDCVRRKFSYEAGYAVFVYDDVMQQAVADYKYRSKREFAAFFAQEMAAVYRERMEKLAIEALVPVPVHRSRRWFRGYNQAEVLCEELSKRIRVPVCAGLLVRTKKTAPQKELDAAGRLQNLEKAIAIGDAGQKERSMPRCVALIDDIYTTGSTAEACARVMKRNGIEKVYVFSLCIGTER